MTRNLVILASDDGEPLLALLKAISDKRLDARIRLVVTNQRGSRAQDRAEDAGIPTLYHPIDWYEVTGRSAENYDADLADYIQKSNPDLVVLSGWDCPIGERFRERFSGRLADVSDIFSKLFNN